MEYENLRKQVVDAGLRMFREGLTHGTSGNVSCRVPSKEKMLITPSSIGYEDMKTNDIILVNFSGEAEETGRNPSSETPFHLAIYKNRSDVGAIVHSHSVYCLAVAASGKTVPVFLDEMFSNIGGELIVTKYELPGSDELANETISKLGDKSAILLANHGPVCCGKNIDEAYHVAETVEKICKIFLLSSSLVEVKSLPPDGVDYQRMMYEMKKDF